MSAVVNPYAPPRARVDDVARANSEAEEIRQEHIKHEASVRSIGILYYLSGGLLCVLAVVMGAGLSAAKTGAPVAVLLGLGAVYLVIGVLMLFVARGVRKLMPWARITTIVLASIGLLGFPLGTVINVYILYLMLAKKGKRIFEDDYKDIIEATPHVKYRTSIIVWIVLGILLLAVIGLIAAATLRSY
jgi:hypothetical protein